jgi:hypothetical protein
MKKIKIGIILAIFSLFLIFVTIGVIGTPQAEISAQTNIAARSDENGAQNDGTTPTLPDFMPSIKDKGSYDEMQQLMRNTTFSPPVPESEMAWIVFSKTRFIQNDENPRADMVQLTFPITWLDTSPVSDDEAVVLLRVPKRLLELGNTNSDPEMITVLYPDTSFREFSNIMAINLTPQAQEGERTS